jgi:hypothetical protein
MSVSVLVVSDSTLEGLPAQAQTLIFPNNGEVHIYHRVSNGQKGRGQAWRKTSLNDLPTDPITHEPCATLITERDRVMIGLGSITNLGIKALYSLETAQNATGETSHRDMATKCLEMITNGDQALSTYITDKRRANGVSIAPIANAVQAEPTKVADISVKGRTIEVREETLQRLEMVSVPDPKWAKEYINRRIEGVSDFEIYDYAMANKHNVLIEGHAGSGKTMSVQAYASARGLRYFNVACHVGIEPSHLVGRWIPTADGHFAWQDGAVTDLVRNGGVLLFNEINFMPERISTFIFSLLDYRREIQILENGGEVIKAHPELLIVADMNPNYRGTRPLNQAFADRFAIRLDFPYDKAIESKLIKNKSLIEMANQLRDQYTNKAISTPISTRSLVAFLNNVKQFGLDFATYSYINTFNGDTEKSAVRLVIETHRENIARELGLSSTLPTLTEQVEVGL